VLSGAKVVTGSVAELYGSHVSSSAAYGFEVDSGSYAVITAADQSDFGGNGAGFWNETPNVAGNRNSWIER